MAGTLTQPSLLDLDTPRPSLLDTIAEERAASLTREPKTAGGPTLEDLVTGAWGALQAGEPAACLACGTTLTPRYGAGARPLAGRCSGCGSELR
jgi:hypothetical protein